jgi:hypothetical protein
MSPELYTGTLTADLTEMVQRAEVNAMANELKPYHDAGCRCDWCRDDREQKRLEILNSMERDRFYSETNELGQRRCIGCKQFSDILPGTDECRKCNAEAL